MPFQLCYPRALGWAPGLVKSTPIKADNYVCVGQQSRWTLELPNVLKSKGWVRDSFLLAFGGAYRTWNLPYDEV